MRDSFIFYRSFHEAIKELPKESQADAYNAVIDYALNEKENDLNGITKAIFTLIKPQLDANNQKYKNGQKGGRPKKKENQNETKTKANKNQNETKTKANVNENENENENDNDNVNADAFNYTADDSCVDGLQNVNDSCVDGLQKSNDSCVDGLKNAIRFYEQNIGFLAPHNLELLEDYRKEMPEDVIIYAIEKTVESNKRSMQYIKAILNNWSKKGIKTLADAKQETENFKNKNRNDETEEEKNARKLRELEEMLKNDSGGIY